MGAKHLWGGGGGGETSLLRNVPEPIDLPSPVTQIGPRANSSSTNLNPLMIRLVGEIGARG